jgi:hypothetical protein
MISRRTIVFFVISIVCFGILKYRTWEQDRPCREWQRNHAQGQTDPPPVQQPDGSTEVAFNPCFMWREMPVIDKLLVLGGFVSSVAFVVSLIQDFVWWLRRRRIPKRL